jgi:ribose/xylose/arabinose/galactoside ABC-type transport system permease subunit
VVLISLGFAVTTQGSWLSVGNLQSVSQLTAVLAVMAFGEAIIIATGEIDISVGSVSGIGALTFLGLAPITGSGVALLAALVCGILIGAMNGVFVALVGIPSLLVTLGSLFLFQGIGYAITSGFSFAATASILRGIQSFLIILGVQPQWYILVVGLIVVLASLADRTLTRFALKQ